jgi:hypothetical protein
MRLDQVEVDDPRHQLEPQQVDRAEHRKAHYVDESSGSPIFGVSRGSKAWISRGARPPVGAVSSRSRSPAPVVPAADTLSQRNAASAGEYR